MKLKRKEPLIIVITVINNKRQPLFLKMIFEKKLKEILNHTKLMQKNKRGLLDKRQLINPLFISLSKFRHLKLLNKLAIRT